MKNFHFPTALKTGALALLCVLFALNSLSAQNGTLKDKVKAFREHCTEMLSALPNVGDIQASPALSATDRQKVLSAVTTFEAGSQIKDDAPDATFSALKKNVESVETWLLTFRPSGAPSAAKANDSPNSGDSPLEKCFKGCSGTFNSEMDKCSKNRTSSSRDRAVCQANALGAHVGCMINCSFQH